MFPDPCGEAWEAAVAGGADPALIVPDEYFVVRGGTKPMPLTGQVFSGATGPSLETAAAAVPFGQLRFSTAGAIRAGGGTVTWVPEMVRNVTMNLQQVNIIEGDLKSFSALQRNPVRAADRICGQTP